MIQITIISGKGGTGKTSLTASLVALSNNTVIADCDVDASNLHLLLNPEISETIEFKGLKLAVIDQLKCINCGLCMEKCRFDAIKDYVVNSNSCEGCGLCVYICPVKAIDFIDRVCGYAYISDTDFGPMVHARLNPGMENSGKLVTLVRQKATEIAENNNKNLVLIDGPPGIGCPVIASLASINAAIIVVEPTLSGIHDLERAISLTNHFNIIPLVCINKYDINNANTDAIRSLCLEKDINILGLIPFDNKVTKAMVEAKSVIKYDPNSPASIEIKKIWSKLNDIFNI
ncbi:4Fe-4S binding protein [Candidatus Bathyarchaeota archaeon]|nr:4Fe-4S binding protein [Candidatus Bathyarchaeota archaeon]